MARTPTCDDCYFRKNALCAMRPASVCPTFRAVRAGRPVKPQQASLVEIVRADEPVLAGSTR